MNDIEILTDCLDSCTKKKKLIWSDFFEDWFRRHGRDYFFLFKKNLSVTNMQFVELFALLQTHAIRNPHTGRSSDQLMFYSTDELRTFVSETVEYLATESKSRGAFKKQLHSFAEKYIGLFRSAVVVDMFYGSAAVFLPPGLDVDLNVVCAESGYVHSAGRSLYVRNVEKAEFRHLHGNLNRRLNELSDEWPIPFVIYAKEDFSDDSDRVLGENKNGIDDVKMLVDKMTFENMSIPFLVDELREQFAGKIQIPPPGPHKKTHIFERTPKRTFFLILDCSISPTELTKPLDGSRYYICYEQIVKAGSPFFHFDENKPAWKSHTTMPHSLTAALINACRPFSEKWMIVDPFGGTGTTWFEAKRIGLTSPVECSDLEPVCQQLVADNLEFFLLELDELQILVEQMHVVLDIVNHRITSGQTASSTQFNLFADTNVGPDYDAAKSFRDNLLKNENGDIQEFEFKPAQLAQLRGSRFLTRLLIYVCLRAQIRHAAALHRGARSFEQAFAESLRELIDQSVALVELRKKPLIADSNGNSPNFLLCQDKYSPITVPAFDHPDSGNRSDLIGLLSNEILTRDGTTLRPNSCDLLICDPPYGINTNENFLNLAETYCNFIRAAVSAVRPNGNLIICLPQRTHTGQRTPFCTRSFVVTGQVITAAREIGKTVFRPANRIPRRSFSPPYYWASEKALTRTILHFRIGSEG